MLKDFFIGGIITSSQRNQVNLTNFICCFRIIFPLLLNGIYKHQSNVYNYYTINKFNLFIIVESSIMFSDLQKEYVKFGMYSCNWTAMNLKTRKLLLLAMRVEDANKLMIKSTPKKIINLQLFNSVKNVLYE